MKTDRDFILARWSVRSQRRLFWLVLFGMLVWPLVHMVWSTKEGFSPWRYAGWGMYATIEPRCVIDVVLEGPNVRREEKLERLGVEVSGIEVSEVLLFESAVRVFRRGDLDIRQIEFDDLLRLGEIKMHSQRFVRLNELQGLHNLLRVLTDGLSKTHENLVIKAILRTPKFDVEAQHNTEHLRRFRYFVGSDRLVEAAPYVKMPPEAKR